jgi:glycosyltransferase involved in cell wall biosynthesis
VSSLADNALSSGDPVHGDPIHLALFIDEISAPAGTENQLLLLLQHWNRARIAPVLFTLHGARIPRWVGGTVRHVDLEVKRLASVHCARSVLEVSRTLRRSRIDMVLTFFRDASLFGTAAAAIANIPVIASRRNLGRDYWHTPNQLRLLRPFNALTRWFVANSEAVRSYTAEVEHVPLEKITVIKNAIDTRYFRPPTEAERLEARARLAIPEADPVIACIANLRPVKDHRTLLRAFARVQTGGARAHLVLAGSGPEEFALRQDCADLGITERVRFLGPLTHTLPVLHAADVAVLSSIAESLPNAVIESLACGVPVAATDVGGVPELLAGQSFGRLAPPRSPEALAAALAATLDGPARDPVIRGAARAYAEENFSLARILDQWCGFLENCRYEIRR